MGHGLQNHAVPEPAIGGMEYPPTSIGVLERKYPVYQPKAIQCAPCMEYFPTFGLNVWYINVGKYSIHGAFGYGK